MVKDKDKIMVLKTIRKEIEHGKYLFMNDRPKEALMVFRSVLNRDPNNIKTLNNKAVALNSIGRNNETFHTFLEILKHDPTPDAAFNLISTDIASGKSKNK